MKYVIALVLSLSLLACGSVKPVVDLPDNPRDTTILVKTEIKKELDTALMQEVLSGMLNMLDSSHALFIGNYYVDLDSFLLAQSNWEYQKDSISASFKKKLEKSLKNCGTVKTVLIYQTDSTLARTNEKLLDSIQTLHYQLRVTSDEKGTAKFSEGVHQTGNLILGILLILIGLYTAFFIKRKK